MRKRCAKSPEVTPHHIVVSAVLSAGPCGLLTRLSMRSHVLRRLSLRSTANDRRASTQCERRPWGMRVPSRTLTCFLDVGRACGGTLWGSREAQREHCQHEANTRNDLVELANVCTGRERRPPATPCLLLPLSACLSLLPFPLADCQPSPPSAFLTIRGPKRYAPDTPACLCQATHRIQS